MFHSVESFTKVYLKLEKMNKSVGRDSTINGERGWRKKKKKKLKEVVWGYENED